MVKGKENKREREWQCLTVAHWMWSMLARDPHHFPKKLAPVYSHCNSRFPFLAINSHNRLPPTSSPTSIWLIVYYYIQHSILFYMICNGDCVPFDCHQCFMQILFFPDLFFLFVMFNNRKLINCKSNNVQLVRLIWMNFTNKVLLCSNI